MVMETYHRRRARNIPSQPAINNIEMMSSKRQDQSNFIHSAQLPSLTRQLMLPCDDIILNRHFEVGAVYEIDHANLPIRSSVQLKSMRVVMVTEKKELNVTVRYPSIGSLCTYLSSNKISSVDIYPFLDEMFVMGKQLAGKVLSRQISSQEFDDNKHFEGFWLVKNSGSLIAEDVISKKDAAATPLISRLKSNGMVRWGIRRQVKFLNKHGLSTSHQQSSSSFVTGDIGKFKLEADEDGDGDNEENDDEEDNDDVEEGGGGEETDDDKENLKRKRYCFRNLVNRKAKKVKVENQRQVKKKPKNNCKKIVLGNSKNRWSAERYRLAEENLLEVMKAKGAVFNSPILRPVLRLEARKRIGDTGLLDHLLKHMAGKIAPGGAERFRRRHNADGAMEYWLESADLVTIRKEAGVQDPYWTPPPGWSPGDCPSQDPICAKEFKLLKEENIKLRRDLKEMVSKKQFKEEIEKLRREIELVTKKRQEQLLAIQVSNAASISQKHNPDSSLMAPLKSDIDSALGQLHKHEEQLINLSDTQTGMKEEIGRLNSKVEDLKRSGTKLIASSRTKESCAEKDKKQVANSEKSKAPTVLSSSGVGNGGGNADVVLPQPQGAALAVTEKTAAEEKAVKIQKLKSGFRICKPQGTFLWPNMARNNNKGNTSSSANMSPHQVVVQVEDLFVVPTPPSVSSSTSSAPPQLPFHRPPTSPVKPVPERRAITRVTVSTARPYEDGGNIGYSTTTTTTTSTTTNNQSSTSTLINLNEIPNPDELTCLTPSSRQSVSTITTTRPLLQSIVKREMSDAASAWERAGSSHGSNQVAADTITGAKNAMDDTNCSQQQQQRRRSSSSTASLL